MLRPLQRKQRKNRNNLHLIYRPWSSFLTKTRKRGIETHCVRQPLPERREKETFNRRIRVTDRSLGIRDIPLLPIRETGPIFPEPSST